MRSLICFGIDSFLKTSKTKPRQGKEEKYKIKTTLTWNQIIFDPKGSKKAKIKNKVRNEIRNVNFLNYRQKLTFFDVFLIKICFVLCRVWPLYDFPVTSFQFSANAANLNLIKLIMFVNELRLLHFRTLINWQIGLTICHKAQTATTTTNCSKNHKDIFDVTTFTCHTIAIG